MCSARREQLAQSCSCLRGLPSPSAGDTRQERLRRSKQKLWTNLNNFQRAAEKCLLDYPGMWDSCARARVCSWALKWWVVKKRDYGSGKKFPWPSRYWSASSVDRHWSQCWLTSIVVGQFRFGSGSMQISIWIYADIDMDAFGPGSRRIRIKAFSWQISDVKWNEICKKNFFFRRPLLRAYITYLLRIPIHMTVLSNF